AIEVALHGEAREGDVAGSLAGAGGLLTDAVLAIDDGRLARGEAQREPDALGYGGKSLCSGGSIPTGFPVAVPDAGLVEAGAGDARAGAIQALVVPEAAAVDVGKGKVGEIEIVGTPGRRVGGRDEVLALAEVDEDE